MVVVIGLALAMSSFLGDCLTAASIHQSGASTLVKGRQLYPLIKEGMSKKQVEIILNDSIPAISIARGMGLYSQTYYDEFLLDVLYDLSEKVAGKKLREPPIVREGPYR